MEKILYTNVIQTLYQLMDINFKIVKLHFQIYHHILVTLKKKEFKLSIKKKKLNAATSNDPANNVTDFVSTA